jgi:multiple sugar transport system permease protein
MNNIIKKIFKREYKTKKVIVYSVLYIFLLIIVLITLTPFIIVLLNSTRESLDIQRGGMSLIPGRAFLDNWKSLISVVDIMQGFINSLFITTTVTILTGYISALTAYGFHFYKFKLNKPLFGLIILFIMVPGQLAFIGFYELMLSFNLIDSYFALIVPPLAAIGSVFFLRQFIQGAVSK